jgi:hypothetical protein
MDNEFFALLDSDTTVCFPDCFAINVWLSALLLKLEHSIYTVQHDGEGGWNIFRPACLINGWTAVIQSTIAYLISFAAL